MKVRLIVAVLLLSVWPAKAQYGTYIGVQSLSVSGWDGCKGTLTAVLNKVTSPTNQYPVDRSDNVGKNCAPSYDTPYSYGCYTLPGARSISIQINARLVTQLTGRAARFCGAELGCSAVL